MSPRINYRHISEAIDFYEDERFEYIEVPWIVSPEAVAVTLPSGASPLGTLGGTLVGSAEQSFIHLACNGDLKPGCYSAATPCFRDDTPDELHQRTFFKVELIEISQNPIEYGAVQWMAEIAQRFFHTLPGGADTKIVRTSTGLDLELHGVEVGSYGLREYDGWFWLYGTGLAEPRFSIAALR